jgi:hypothetical protein
MPSIRTNATVTKGSSGSQRTSLKLGDRCNLSRPFGEAPHGILPCQEIRVGMRQPGMGYAGQTGMTASFVSDVSSISTVRRRHLESLQHIRTLRSQARDDQRRARLAALRARRTKPVDLPTR